MMTSRLVFWPAPARRVPSGPGRPLSDGKPTSPSSTARRGRAASAHRFPDPPRRAAPSVPAPPPLRRARSAPTCRRIDRAAPARFSRSCPSHSPFWHRRRPPANLRPAGARRRAPASSAPCRIFLLAREASRRGICRVPTISPAILPRRRSGARATLRPCGCACPPPPGRRKAGIVHHPTGAAP